MIQGILLNCQFFLHTKETWSALLQPGLDYLIIMINGYYVLLLLIKSVLCILNDDLSQPDTNIVNPRARYYIGDEVWYCREKWLCMDKCLPSTMRQMTGPSV